MKYLSLWPSESNFKGATAFDLFSQFDNEFAGVKDGFYPALDVEESKDRFQVYIDVPGIKKEDIKIEAKDRRLFISGERKREIKSENDVNRSERLYGRFTRTLQLPLDVDSNKIEAHYENGVLTLTLPKSEAAQPRLIDIK